MKKTMFLLALVVGLAMAEENEVAEEEGRGGGLLKVLKVSALASILGPLGVLIEIGLQIVILIALIMFIGNLKNSVGDLGALFSKGEDDYGGYYPAPAYDVGATGGSSYASTGAVASAGGSGYYKRSVDSPSIADLPVMQRMSARVQEAIENFNY